MNCFARVGGPAFAASLAVLLIGVALTVRSLGMRAEAKARLERCAQDLGMLEVFERNLRLYEAEVAAFEKMPSARPERLSKLLSAVLPGSEAEILEKEPRPLLDDWVVREATVSFSDIGFADLAKFIGGIEAERPPWRLKRCELRSSAQEAGRGEAVLVVEAPEKRDRREPRPR